MATYYPVGQPINEAEKTALRLLRSRLPDHYFVIGNFELQLPRRANSLEYDAVVVGEYGIYAVEIKGWGGRIEGDARRWMMEWGRVENPFIRTEQKAKALRHFLVERVPDFPDDVFCQSVVMLPGEVELHLDDPRASRVIGPGDVFDFFVDPARIVAQGPGPLLDAQLRRSIFDVLIPFARARPTIPVLTDYDIEAELEAPGAPYRELVGRPRLLRSRKKVRIKMYTLDPLTPAAKRAARFERIVRDVEALVSLDENPYVASAYDVRRDQEDELRFYLVTEWVGPRTLRDYMDAGDGDETDRLSFARHLLRAVAFMHRQGIVHRNLHPDVIYLTAGKGAVPLKIADFDYARVADLPSIASQIDRIGKEGYVAPEMWMEQEYDHRVDLFSLGAILFELFAGRPLYDTLSDMMNHAQIWQARRQAISPPQILRVLDELLQFDPARRPDDVEELIAWV